MKVVQICGWHKFFIICIFFLMAAQMFNSATDWLFSTPKYAIGLTRNWLFILKWCLQPSRNWLPDLTLAGNQDTRIQYFSSPDHQDPRCCLCLRGTIMLTLKVHNIERSCTNKSHKENYSLDQFSEISHCVG